MLQNDDDRMMTLLEKLHAALDEAEGLQAMIASLITHINGTLAG